MDLTRRRFNFESGPFIQIMNTKLRYISLQVSVYPREVQPENPNSYRARKREYFRLQRERKKARKEGSIAQPQLVLASSDATETNPVC